MTREGICAFLAVVQTGNMTAAANNLFITQPALSRRLQFLEKELNCKLLTRGKGKREIHLTPYGKSFLPIARQFDALFLESDSLSLNQRSRRLKIACFGSLQQLFMIPCYQSFLQLHPEVNIEISGQHTTDCYSLVESGIMDIGFVSGIGFNENVKNYFLFAENFFCVSHSHLKTELDPLELDPASEVRFTWIPECEAWRHKYLREGQSQILTDDASILKPLMTAGRWAIVPETCIGLFQNDPAYVIHKLTQPLPARFIYYIIRTSEEKDPIIQDFISIVRKKAKSTILNDISL